MFMRGVAVLGWSAQPLPIPIPIAGPILIGTVTTIPKPLRLLLRPPPFLFQYQTRDWRLSWSSSSSGRPAPNNLNNKSNSMESTVKDQQPRQGDLIQEEEKKKENPSPPPPPPAAASKPLDPPEKPLPGDCCGSGCVRCVWDIYYEELEAYNNSLSSSSSNSS